MQITAAFVEKADGAVTRRNIKLKAVELEDPREDEDLIKVTSCGVCGTDQEIIHGLELVPASGVLGHEGAGIVGAIDDSDDHKMIKPIVRMRWTHEGEAPCHRTRAKKARSPLILPPATGPGDRDQVTRPFAPRA
jgi:Zn-dependent alcohol dehydrogenase